MREDARTRSYTRHAIILPVLLLIGILTSSPAHTAEEPVADLAILQDSVSTLRALLKANVSNPELLGSLSEDGARLALKLQKCARDHEKQAPKLEAELAGLGEPLPKDSLLLREQRKSLNQQLDDTRVRLTTCRVLLEETQSINDEIRAHSRSILRQKLLFAGTPLLRIISNNLMDLSPLLTYGTALFEQYNGLLALGIPSLLILVGVMLVAMLPGWFLRSWLLRWGEKRTDNDFTSILLQSSMLGLARYLPWLLATITGSVFFALVPEKPDDFRFWAYVTYSLTAFLAFMLGVRVLLYPFRQLPSPVLLPPQLARAMAQRLRVLGLLCLLGVIHYASLQVLHLPVSTQELIRGVFLSLLALNLLWFVWLLGSLPRMERTSRRVRGVLALFLVSSLVAEWLGYRALSSYLLLGVVGTSVLVSLAWILHVMLAELASGIGRGKYAWQRRLRQAVGLSDDQTFPGLSTLRFLLVLGLWTALVLLLMKLWGVPDSLVQRFYIGFQSGFQIGELYITPSRIIIALLIFVLLLQVFNRLKESLEKRWLPASKLDRGAREATATMFGYLGILVAVLVGLSAAGLDLTKLALIAGALSIGIGFGLQNVVNNFVSGLILLFERPINTGDFISVGDTEGYVRRISIRSTEIETLDRRSVIVPNSDLISGQVINWMRKDSYGRVKLEIGVAYGSDLRLVHQVLRDIVTSHPEVRNDSQTQPAVFCSGFGDSSINFTIYAVVSNFTQRLQVAHDIYMAIEASFARHDIEIPFPQRVLHTAQEKNAEVMDRPPASVTAGPRQSDPLNTPDRE